MTFYEDKHVLVTGATGLVGRHLFSALRDAGARIKVIVHERPLPGAGSVWSKMLTTCST